MADLLRIAVAVRLRGCRDELLLIVAVEANWIETKFPTGDLTGLKHAKCVSLYMCMCVRSVKICVRYQADALCIHSSTETMHSNSPLIDLSFFTTSDTPHHRFFIKAWSPS